MKQLSARLDAVRRSALGRVLLFLLCAVLRAQPALTTVQDTLFMADGTRFNGTATVTWPNFTASDGTTVAGTSVTTGVVDGALRISLVPTTNALSTGVFYTVRYISSTNASFSERWYVPPSAAGVRLRDVRTAPPGGGSGGTTVQIGDVAGLSAELNVRPTRGVGYGPGRVVRAAQNGQLESVLGAADDCVRVDGTSGPCGAGGGSAPSFADSETPAGLINGTNVVFTLANPPVPAESLELYRNGLRQRAGVDFTLAGNQVTFLAAATPQAGDILIAQYRIAGPGAGPSAAGGDLTGSYPNPRLADGVVRNQQIASSAAIAESKLALNFPTHSSANDPTGGEKQALAGTAGTPSASNRFVTAQDTRLTDARTPTSHPLLGTAHSDVTAATVRRGDLVTGQGATATTWARLPLGLANRCLTSNGADAVWNTCLFTNFPQGAVPFTDSQGNLAQDAARLFWNVSNRRLGVGLGIPLTTLHVQDAAAGSGTTTLTVQAGAAQANQPLQRWQDFTGLSLAQVTAGGQVQASRFQAQGSTQASWSEQGLDADPATTADGDQWFDQTRKVRRSVAGAQTHAQPQVICSSGGLATSDTALQVLDSCRIPLVLIRPGDRFEIRAEWSAAGGTGSTAVTWNGTALLTRTISNGIGSQRVDVVVDSAALLWSGWQWEGSSGLSSAAGQLAAATGEIAVQAQGARTGAGGTVRLVHLLVVRYPLQLNE